MGSGIGNRFHTYYYDMEGCRPNGKFTVGALSPNGVVDGVAFSLLCKKKRKKKKDGGEKILYTKYFIGADKSGRQHIIKSRGAQSGQNVLGIYPQGNCSVRETILQYASSIVGAGFTAMMGKLNKLKRIDKQVGEK